MDGCAISAPTFNAIHLEAWVNDKLCEVVINISNLLSSTLCISILHSSLLGNNLCGSQSLCSSSQLLCISSGSIQSIVCDCLVNDSLISFKHCQSSGLLSSCQSNIVSLNKLYFLNFCDSGLTIILE